MCVLEIFPISTIRFTATASRSTAAGTSHNTSSTRTSKAGATVRTSKAGVTVRTALADKQQACTICTPVANKKTTHTQTQKGGCLFGAAGSTEHRPERLHHADGVVSGLQVVLNIDQGEYIIQIVLFQDCRWY